jgi:WD40 repeat protein
MLSRHDIPASSAESSPREDRFTVVRLHATGGLGQVHLARDEKLKRPVALKEIRPDKRDNASLRQRFLMEAEITGQLEHPGIVPIYDLDEGAGGQVRYAMRFVQGRTLRSAILAYHREPAPLALRELLQRFVSVCQTIAYAHSQGVIHRDLKPDNVLLGDYGETLVVDWGIARRFGTSAGRSDLLAATPAPIPQAPMHAAPNQTTDFVAAASGDEPLTQAGQVLGTPAYMAPEQAAGDVEAISTPADVYSLGAILYEVLTGRPPHQGRNVDEVLASARSGRFPRPAKVRRGVPAALEAVCLKALAREIGQRYLSATDLARDVEQWLADEPVRAYREPWTARLGRWLRKHQTAAAAVAALLLTGVVALAISTALVGQALKKEEKAREDALAESQRAEEALHQGQLLAANLAFDRGLTLGDRGDVGVGVLWLVRGLELAPEDAGPLRTVLRANLAAWRGRLSTLQAVWEHDIDVNAVAFSRDGRVALTGTGHHVDPNLRTTAHGTAAPAAWLWDVSTGQRLGEPLTHPAPVLAVTLSADGRTALTGCADGKARLWDLAGRRAVVRVFAHEGPVNAVVFRPDGRAIATGSDDGRARLWSLSTGESIGAPLRHTRPVRAVAFRPDGEVLLTGSHDGTIGRWEGNTAKPVGTFRHDAAINALAWSPDGRRIVVGGLGNEARLLDAATGKVAVSLPHTGYVLAVAFASDGQTVATGGDDNMARVWDATSGEPVGQPLPHLANIRALAFTPDCKRLLTAGSETCARLWECAPLGSGEVIPQLDQSAERLLGATAIRPDGRVVAFGWLRGAIQLGAVATGKPVGPARQCGGPVGALAFSPDGKKLLIGGLNKMARLHDAASLEPVGPPLAHAAAVKAAAFTADGRLVVTATLTGTAQLWDVASGAAVGRPMEHRSSVWAVAVAPDGKTVVTGGDDGTARLWNAATGQLQAPPLRHGGAVMAVAFNRDGQRVATGGNDNAGRVWDAGTGQPLTLPLRHAGQVFDVAFRPDGRLLVTASQDRTAQVWDVATGKRVGPRLEHPLPVHSAAFAGDVQTLVTVTRKGRMRTWNLQTHLDAEPERLALWAQVRSGMELDRDGGVHVLSATAWRQRLEQFAAR